MLQTAACTFRGPDAGNREPDGGIDASQIDANQVDATSSTRIHFEAESFDRTIVGTGLFLTASARPDFVGSGYLVAAESSCFVPVCGGVEYDFSVSTAGSFHVHMRTLASGNGSNSFYWSLESRSSAPEPVFEPIATTPINQGVPPSGEWTWVFSNTQYSVELGAGDYSLILSVREAGVEIDRIAISDSSTPPSN